MYYWLVIVSYILLFIDIVVMLRKPLLAVIGSGLALFLAIIGVHDSLYAETIYTNMTGYYRFYADLATPSLVLNATVLLVSLLLWIAMLIKKAHDNRYKLPELPGL